MLKYSIFHKILKFVKTEQTTIVYAECDNTYANHWCNFKIAVKRNEESALLRTLLRLATRN